MHRLNEMCEKCAGIGYINQRYIPNHGDEFDYKIEQDICDECGGTGHREYAIFSIEEAKAILKHCGLTTES